MGTRSILQGNKLFCLWVKGFLCNRGNPLFRIRSQIKIYLRVPYNLIIQQIYSVIPSSYPVSFMKSDSEYSVSLCAHFSYQLFQRKKQTWRVVEMAETLYSLLQQEKRDLSIELGLILNTAQASGNLQPSNRVGAVGEKLLRGNIKGKGDSGETNLTGSLLKIGQVHQTSPEGWCRMMNLITRGHHLWRVGGPLIN